MIRVNVKYTVRGEGPDPEGPSKKLNLTEERFFVLDKYDSYITPMIDGVTNNQTPVLGYNLKTNPCQIYYDFGKDTPNKIQKIRIYDGSGTFLLKIFGVAVNTFEKILLLETNNPNYGVWNDFEIESPTMFRYLLFEVADWNIPSEIEVFGSYKEGPIIIPPILHRSTLRAMTGINGFEWNWLADPWNPSVNQSQIYAPKVDLFKKLGNFRQYVDWVKIQEAGDDRYKFSPTYNGDWRYDVIYESAKENGMLLLPCFQKIPKWMENTWPESKRLDDNIPVKYPAPFNIPESFIEYGRLAFQFAARYGSNQNINPDLVKIDISKPNEWTDANVVKIGLNTISWMEANNEPDRWWRDADAKTGRNSYMTGREYAASLSAFYDGHKGSMGADVGAKSADSNMKVAMAGIASDKTDYVKGIISWCEEFRGYHSDGKINLPFEAINWHFYPSDASSQGASTRGVAPEVANWDIVIYDFNKLRVHNPDLELWITEIGYDDVNTSDIYVPPIGDKSSREVIADWTLRISLMGGRTGIDRIFFFQIFDEGKIGRFNSSGLFIEEVTQTEDFVVTDVVLDRKPSGNTQVALCEQFGEYRFDSTINNNPHIDKYINGSDIMYAAWVPDEIDRREEYELQVPSGLSKVYVYTLDYHSLNPIIEEKEVGSGKVLLQLTERPIFIKLQP